MKKTVLLLSLLLIGCGQEEATINDINVSLPSENVVSLELSQEETQEEVDPEVEEIEEVLVEDIEVFDDLSQDDILWLQESLKIAGFYTARDGSFGPSTEKTLKAFQTANNLESHAYDSLTYDLLYEIRKEKLAPKFGTNLVLLNKLYYLPSDYIPDHLREVKVDKNKYMELPEHVAVSVEQMFMDAKADDINIVLASAYRSYDYQENIFSRRVANYGFEEAEKVVAIPGESEHQTGLAIDITSEAMNFGLGQEFENDPVFEWMMENCYKYGFILRYPKGREDDTGYIYEPWHYRYIGDVEIAEMLMTQDLILEEYFE